MVKLTISEALQRAIAFHEESKLQDAERLYGVILQSQPTHPDANHNLGVLAVSGNKFDVALPLFKTALKANPQRKQFWFSYIDALIKGQKFKEAKQVIEQVKSKGMAAEKLTVFEKQLFVPDQVNKSQSASRKKKPTFAVKRKTQTEAKGDKKNKKPNTGHSPSDIELNKLLLSYKNGQFYEAEKLAVSLTEKFPKHPFSWKVLGALLKQTDRITESLTAAQTALQLAPRDTDAHYNLSNILKELGRLEEAEASYRKAIALKPDFALAHSNLGNTLKELGRLEEAEASYRKAIALKPDFALAHSNLGNTLKELGRLEEAEASYRKAIVLEPHLNEYHYNLGITLKEIGKLEEAEASYTKTITLKPEFAEAHNNLGITLRELGRLDEAKASFTKAKALKPEFAEAHNNLGITLMELGRLDEAEASYAKAIALKPDYASAKHMFAALTGTTTTTTPKAFVEKLFDNYAAKFENSLVNNLKYEIPKLIAQIVIRDSKFDLLGSIMDLGCGSGLFGMEIHQSCNHLEGIDISAKMLAEAKKKNIYKKLIKQDIGDYLLNESLNFDYYVSTDVFIYIGDLSDVFRLIKSRNKTSGKLAFSTENYDGDGFFLEKSGRYSHSKKYIESLCGKFGYKLCHFETQNLRKEKDQYISGGLYLLEF